MSADSHADRIDWQEWSDEVFQHARQAEKLILVDSGATWCHWCHVMDRVTYEDPEVVDLLAGRFIPVRIDRDRLPEIDARLQRSPALVQPMGNAGGWPLTVVLTPSGGVLFKATFLPPRASQQYGVPTGLVDLLEKLDDYWHGHRAEIEQAAQKNAQATGLQLAELFRQPGQLDRSIITQILQALAREHDANQGGFGGAPKFFHTPALRLLLTLAPKNTQARQMLCRTLDALAAGGVYDQIGGGFHRYSVDAEWHVPHFEKMASDNAALLGLFADAYAFTGKAEYRRVARQSLGWIAEVLGGQEGSEGFFASQDADVGLDDDGDYFTWTIPEVRQALGDRAELAIRHFGLTEDGDMHSRPGRNVLRVAVDADTLASEKGMTREQVRKQLQGIRETLADARGQRTAPQVDRTVFADLNGMLIDACLAASSRLEDQAPQRVALGVLDRLLDTHRDHRGVFGHYRAPDGRLVGVGQLADQAWAGQALVRAYTRHREPTYIEAAAQLADYVLSELTASDGGFVTAPAGDDDAPLSTGGRRTWEDAAGRSEASVAAEWLIALGHLTGEQKYTDAARAALESFAGADFGNWGLFVAGFAVAAERLLDGPRTVVLIGPSDDPRTVELRRAAGSIYWPGEMIVAVDPNGHHVGELVDALGYTEQAGPTGYVCANRSCLPPARTGRELSDRISEARDAAQPPSDG